VSSVTNAVLFEIGTERRHLQTWLLPLHSKPAVSENDRAHSRHDDGSKQQNTILLNPNLDGWLSRFLTAHQHHLGYLVPLLGKIKQMQ